MKDVNEMTKDNLMKAVELNQRAFLAREVILNYFLEKGKSLAITKNPLYAEICKDQDTYRGILSEDKWSVENALNQDKTPESYVDEFKVKWNEKLQNVK